MGTQPTVKRDEQECFTEAASEEIFGRNSRNQDMEIGALETVMEERGAVGWCGGVQLEQHQLKVAGGRHWRGGQGQGMQTSLGTAPVRDQSTQCLHLKDPLCAGAAQMGKPGSTSPPHLSSSQGNFSDGPPTASLSRCPKRPLLLHPL